MNSYEALFTPMQIGGVTVKNRVVLCAMGGTSPFGHFGYAFNDKIRDYYEERARGNVGLMIPGVTAVKSGNSYLYQAEDVFMGPVKDLMDMLHSYGSKLFLQLGAGFGRAQMVRPDMDPEMMAQMLVAPSDGLPNVWEPDMKHRGLTVEEIEDIIDAFGKSAALCKRAGIDGVEIHAVHEGYLLDQFAVSNTNHRTDEYGGSLENRFRFVTSIIKEIKKTCGKDFPVSVRYSVTSKMRGFNQGALPGENYVEFGRSMEESPAAARLLEAAGADALNADNGSYDSWFWAHPPVYMPLNCNLPEVAYIKNFVNIPVFCAGRMENPETAAEAVASGKIDGIGVARQFLADPQWLNKAREGKADDIRPCIACHNGCFAISHFRGVPSRAFGMAHCAVNPAAMNEAEYALVPTDSPKKVAVVGGGIGGMEAARLLKLRGHEVTLYEKSDELGGVFIAAAAPSFKEKDKMLIDWYNKQLKDLNIPVKLSTEATVEILSGYDEVIIATGAAPRKLQLPGLDEAEADGKVIEAIDYLRDRKAAGEFSVIIGGGLTGCEIAYDLALKGKRSLLVEMQDDLLKVPGLCSSNSEMLREIVRYYNIGVKLDTAFAGVKNAGDKLSVLLRSADGEEYSVEADSVILSVGYVPGAPLAEKVKAAGLSEDRVHVIGDAGQVGNLLNVIREAYDTAYAI